MMFATDKACHICKICENGSPYVKLENFIAPLATIFGLPDQPRNYMCPGIWKSCCKMFKNLATASSLHFSRSAMNLFWPFSPLINTNEICIRLCNGFHDNQMNHNWYMVIIFLQYHVKWYSIIRLCTTINSSLKFLMLLEPNMFAFFIPMFRFSLFI